MSNVAENKTSKDLIETMFSSGAHYGYSKSRRHPSTSTFIFGVKNGVEIFDLEKTSISLNKALDFVRTLGESNQLMLLVSGKKEMKSVITKTGEDLGVLYVAGRWIGGTLTNFSEIRKRTHKYLDLKEKKDKGELSKYTKKERLLIDREIDELGLKFGGVVTMKELPKALFVIDSKEEKIAVTEAKMMGIPVISLFSSDCDIKDIDFPIPGNDSSVASASFFLSKISEAYKEGQKKSKV